MHRSDMASGLIVVLFSLLLLLWILPNYGGQGFGQGLAPQFMPSVGAYAMLICGVLLVGQTASRMRHARTSPEEATVDRSSDDAFWRWGLFVLWPIAYVSVAILAIASIGLIYSGPFIIAAMLVLIGVRQPVVILLAALIPPMLIYILAVYLMRIGIV